MSLSQHDPDLVAEIRKLVKIKARSLVGQAGFGRQDLGDIEHDLTVRLLQRLEGFDPGRGPLFPFALLIIGCVAANYRRDAIARRAAAGPVAPLDAFAGDAPHRQAAGDWRRGTSTDEQHRREVVLDLEQLLADTPEEQVELLRLAAEYGKKAAARLAGVPDRDVRFAFAQARARLRKAGWSPNP